MTNSEKGKKEFTFAIGTLGKEAKSADQTGTIIICGKESVSLTQSETVERVLRSDDPNTIIDKATYNSWFKWEAGDDSSAECYATPELSLVDENGDAIASSDKLVRLNAQNDIEITNSELSTDSRVIQLKTTSWFGDSNYEKLCAQYNALSAKLIAKESLFDTIQNASKDLGLKLLKAHKAQQTAAGD